MIIAEPGIDIDKPKKYFIRSFAYSWDCGITLLHLLWTVLENFYYDSDMSPVEIKTIINLIDIGIHFNIRSIFLSITLRTPLRIDFSI